MPVLTRVTLVASRMHIKKQLAVYGVNLPGSPTTNHCPSQAVTRGCWQGWAGKAGGCKAGNALRGGDRERARAMGRRTGLGHVQGARCRMSCVISALLPNLMGIP